MSQSFRPVTVNEAKAIFRSNISRTTVDLCCRISAIGLAKQSRGSDYSRTLKVIDSSSLSPFPMVFFASNVDNLPKVMSVGDIIVARQFVIKVHEQEVFCSFNKRSSTYLLFHGNNDMNFEPYEISRNAHVPNHVNAIIQQLRALSLGHPSTSGLTDHLLCLREIEISKVFDMVCKVFYLQDASRDEWMLYVWDGLDAPPLSLQSNLDMELDEPSPLYVEQVPLSTTILTTFPGVGTVLRISIKKNIFQDISHFQNGVYWVKLCNIFCELRSGFWKGVMDMSSKIFFLSLDDYIVQDREREAYTRMRRHESRMPLGRFPEPSHVTELNFGCRSYATLLESLINPQVSQRLKSVVRVVASAPWQSEDIHCPHKGDYRLRLTLEDPTARIHAYVFGDDGVDFFGADPTNDELSRKMNKLLGIEDPNHSAPRNPPWVCCYLKSFQQRSDCDPWSSRKYMIFGTRLVG